MDDHHGRDPNHSPAPAAYPGQALRRGHARGDLLFLASALLACCLHLQACSATNHLWRAQEAFNQAAALENRLRERPLQLSANPAAPVERALGSRTLYSKTLQELEAIGPAERRQLQADGLWGNALTLEALAAWRLGEYDRARAAARAAEGGSARLHPRDAALLAALPGLIKIDEAEDKLSRGEPPEDLSREQHLQAVSSLLSSGFQDIAGARRIVPPNHPVQPYLLQCQLAGYVNLMQAHTRWSDAPNPAPPEPARERALAWFCSLAELLENGQLAAGLEEGEIEAFLQGWAHRTGISPDRCRN